MRMFAHRMSVKCLAVWTSILKISYRPEGRAMAGCRPVWDRLKRFDFMVEIN